MKLRALELGNSICQRLYNVVNEVYLFIELNHVYHFFNLTMAIKMAIIYVNAFLYPGSHLKCYDNPKVDIFKPSHKHHGLLERNSIIHVLCVTLCKECHSRIVEAAMDALSTPTIIDAMVKLKGEYTIEKEGAYCPLPRIQSLLSIIHNNL